MKVLLLLVFLAFPAQAFSGAEPLQKEFLGTARVSIIVDRRKYSSIVEQSAPPLIASQQSVLRKTSVLFKRRGTSGGTESDIIDICEGDLSTCAGLEYPDLYWLDPETRYLHLSNPTEPVYQRSSTRWRIYEAFPLCGWKDTSTDYSAYGGQCYVAVWHSERRTVSLQILLGKGSGCKEPERCWAAELAAFRKMLESIE